MSSFIKKLMEAIFSWGRPKARGNLQDAEIVLTQSASNLTGGRASETNKLMADLAKKYVTTLGVTVFAQEEVAEILRENGVPTVGSTPVFSDVSLKDESYAGSDGIARLQRDFCRNLGYNRVLVIAFVPHAWRAIKVYERLGFEVIVPPDLPIMIEEPEMAQDLWRKKITAYPYELLARIVFLLQGKI